jgi:uncharacterized iron-regulated protein
MKIIMNLKLSTLIYFACVFFVTNSFVGQKSAYTIFNKNGKKVKYKSFSKKLCKSDVVLFGEYHDNPISHWLELELAKDLHERSNLIIGAEMFEADNQEVINQYLNGEINFTSFDTLARLWPNYQTDYSPLLELAKSKNLPLIATNIPRRYAKMVFRNGGFSALDDVSDAEKLFMAPLPIEFDIELSQYKNMLEMMGDHGSDDIVKAQAIKDATMAYFILNNYKSESTLLHVNGAYHSDFFQGILWYLKRANSSLNYKTITTVYQENGKKLNKNNLNRADFIICVDPDMTKTY